MSKSTSLLVAQDKSNGCGKEIKQIFNTFPASELSNEKCCFEDAKEIWLTKSTKPLCPLKNGDSCYQLNQSDNQDSKNDRGSSLIRQISRDLSINCVIRCSRADLGSIASLNREFRSLIRNGEVYRLRRLLGIVEHWVYFACHILEWEAFDPIHHRWMHLPKMEPDECFMFMSSDKESLAVGTELLVFTKETGSFVVHKYSLLTNSWSRSVTPTTPRCLFGSASLGDIAIVAGGCDKSGNVLSSAEMYNSETGTWTHLPNMKRERKLCSAVFMDNKFYVVGGVGSDSFGLMSGEVYDLKTMTWQELQNMYPPFNGQVDRDLAFKAPPLIAVARNELYAAYHANMDVLRYDKRRNSWTVIGKLPEQASSSHGWGLAFRSIGNQLVVVGGPTSCMRTFIEINSWDPDDGPLRWNLLGRKVSESFIYNCTVMGC